MVHYPSFLFVNGIFFAWMKECAGAESVMGTAKIFGSMGIGLRCALRR
jgi:hypothetical protein